MASTRCVAARTCWLTYVAALLAMAYCFAVAEPDGGPLAGGVCSALGGPPPDTSSECADTHQSQKRLPLHHQYGHELVELGRHAALPGEAFEGRCRDVAVRSRIRLPVDA